MTNDDVEPSRRHRPHFHTEYLDETSTLTYNCVKTSPVVSAARGPPIIMSPSAFSAFTPTNTDANPSYIRHRGKRISMHSTSYVRAR